MGSGAVIYIPSFVKIGSTIQKLIGPCIRWIKERIINDFPCHF
jgi:hypothetical protein